MHLESRVPPLRSSDISLANTNPFLYYLIRRLGIHNPLRQSDALDAGTWFHEAAALIDSPDAVSKAQERLSDKCETIRRTLQSDFNLNPDAAQAFADTHYKSGIYGIGIFAAMLRWRQPPSATGRKRDLSDGVAAYLSRYETISIETPYESPANYDAFGTKTFASAVCRPDRLVRNPSTGAVWIVDYKTTADSPSDRIAYCPLEPATSFYIRLIDSIDSTGSADLGPNSYLAGMMHIVIQKPTIRPSRDDCPFHYTSEGKRTKRYGEAHETKDGKWHISIHDTDTGEVFADCTLPTHGAALTYLHEATGKQPSKVYMDETPRLDAYAHRTEQWWRDNCDEDPIDISYTTKEEVLSEPFRSSYDRLHKNLAHYATCDPDPTNFPMTDEGIKRSVYRDFFLAHPSQWSRIMSDHNLTQGWREDTEETP